MLVTPIYNPIPPLENNKLLTNDGTLLSWTDTPTVASLISTGIIRATDFAKTGWPVTSGVTLSFDNASKVFTVTDVGSAYYYIDGVKYTLGGNKTVDLDDVAGGAVEGLWYIYFDGATLTASQTIWSFLDEDKALVAYLYWDATNNKAIFLGWELHTFHMSGATHARLHYAGGARWESGLLVTDTGSETVNVAAGDIWDEDLNIPITDGAGAALFEQVLSPAQLPIYYLDGASNWRIYETNEKAAATDIGYLTGGNLQYNKLNGTWANATVGLNNYVAYYVVATNEQTEPIALIMGQRVDNKLSDAKVNNVFSGLTLTELPFEEMVVLARLILKDTATYTLEEVLDLRVYNIKGNITSPLIPDHGGLAGLGDDDHVQYLLADGTRTLTSLILGADPSIISSAYAIQIKPSGDADDYFEFYTSSNSLKIKTIGSWGFNFESDDADLVMFRVAEALNLYTQVLWNKTSNFGAIQITGDFYIQPNNNNDDYFSFTTVDGVPTISTVGTCDLKITSSSGEIDFDNENLTTLGTITAEQLTSTDDITMQGHLLTLGDDSANDIVISFKGSANDGTITFDEDVGKFVFSHQIRVESRWGLSVDTTGLGVDANILCIGGEAKDAALFLQPDEDDDDADKMKIVGATDGTLSLQGKGSGSWLTGLSMDSTTVAITVPTNLIVEGELQGGRCLLGMGEGETFTADRYLDFYNGQQSSALNGYVMTRAGQVLGVSCSMIISNYSATSFVSIKVLKNGIGTVVSHAQKSITSNGFHNWSGNQTRATAIAAGDTFVAGDVLTLYIDFQNTPPSFTAQDVCAMMELQFDT